MGLPREYMKIFSLRQLRRNKLVIILSAVFLLIYVFIYVALKQLNGIVFQEPVIFEGAEQVEGILKQALGEKRSIANNLSVIYFWKSYCPCNIGVRPHYSRLFDEYVNQGVSFYIADLSENKTILSSYSRHIPKGTLFKSSVSNALAEHVNYTPAIAVFNEQKELLYYGPHNLGFVCNAKTSIVRKVINGFQQGVFSKNINVIGEGCFCRTTPTKR